MTLLGAIAFLAACGIGWHFLGNVRVPVLVARGRIPMRRNTPVLPRGTVGQRWNRFRGLCKQGSPAGK